MDVSFSQRFFVKYLNIKSHENPFTEGAELFDADGRTDRQT